MSLLHAIVLGIVQGLSEFLPISSSGHLKLVPDLLRWHELDDRQSLEKAFDVALHAGTLVAALWYFRRDVVTYVKAAWQSLRRRAVTTVDERVAWVLAISAVPAAVVGALFEHVIDEHLSDPIIIGVNLIVFAVVLDIADRSVGHRAIADIRPVDGVVTGTAQALALMPGVSRSGVTISAGRWCGLDRGAAARVSFLMSLPIIAGAALYKGTQLATGGGIPAGFGGAFLWGFVASAVSGFVAIAALLRLLRTHSFRSFVIYRVALGAAVIVAFATGLR